MGLVLIIVGSIIGVLLFVALPVGVVLRIRRVQRESQTHHVGLIIHRTGVGFHFVKMPRDREVCIDSTISPANPTGMPFTYYTNEGYSPKGLWPPGQPSIFQAQYSMTTWVEGYDKPIDLLGEFRGKEITTVDSAQMLARMRKEKITGVVVQHGDDVAELLDKLEQAQKGNSAIKWIVITCVIMVVGMVVGFYIMHTSNSEILEQLQFLNNGLFGTPGG